MKDFSYFDEISKHCWHLWNANACSLKRNNDKSQETRAKIMLAAFNEIYRRGFQAASLSSILKDTGITKGALYHHFENKVVLGHAVLDEVIHDTIFTHWIEPLKKSDDPIAALTKILNHSGSLMTKEEVRLGCPLNNLAQEMSPIDEGFRDRIATIYQEWQDAIEAALNKGKLEGIVKSEVNSKEEALLFIASLQGCLGFAKSVQKLETLISCGKGLIDRLESMRASNNSINRHAI